MRLDWEETIGQVQIGNKLEDCKTGNGNKCKGTFGTVQRTFGAGSRSGPIKLAQIWESGAFGANSFERCSAVQTQCTHDLVVKIGLEGSLSTDSDADDPTVALRVAGGSQNQSIDCDDSLSNLKDELANGCGPTYKKNTGVACPGTASALWGTSQPWPCAAIQTGSAVNQVAAGLNERVMGTDKPSSCTSPNNWPVINDGDPRILQVFLTPFGSFSGSGSAVVPVTGFATFYLTGWTGQGGGFDNPCQGNGDDAAGNDASMSVVVVGGAGFIGSHLADRRPARRRSSGRRRRRPVVGKPRQSGGGAVGWWRAQDPPPRRIRQRDWELLAMRRPDVLDHLGDRDVGIGVGLLPRRRVRNGYPLPLARQHGIPKFVVAVPATVLDGGPPGLRLFRSSATSRGRRGVVARSILRVALHPP